MLAASQPPQSTATPAVGPATLAATPVTDGDSTPKTNGFHTNNKPNGHKSGTLVKHHNHGHHKHPHHPANKRVEISKFVSKFQKTLGEGWDAYQIAVSLFIVGKLSRTELMDEIAPVLSKKETKHMHNRLLMSMLANCYRIEPLDGISTSLFGNTSRKRKIGSKSSQYEQLKKDVLSLSIRERVRIKGITKESGKRGLVQNFMVLTRQAMVPKVPIVTNNNPTSTTSRNSTPQPNASFNSPSGDGSTANSNAANKNSNNLEMTLVSVKDILDMVNEPLCTESYELPERKRMRDIMLGLAREHGLLGGVSMKAVDVLYIGLQYHLKSIISNVLDNVRAKKEVTDKKAKDRTAAHISKEESSIPESTLPSFKPDFASATALTTDANKITITTEDLFDSFRLTPHTIQPYGTIDYINDVMLRNDDDYDFISRQVIENSKLSSGGSNNSSTWINGEKVVSLGEQVPNYDTENNMSYDDYTYVIPNKLTDISYLLKPHDELVQEIEVQAGPGAGDAVPKINLALKDKDIGTPDELAWVINDLLAEDV